MGENWRDYLPAFFAAAVLLAVSVIKALRIVPEVRWDDFETVTNTVMFGAAVVSLFCVGLPAKRDDERRLGGVLSNLMVSLLAFPLNIAVFEHIIDWVHPLNAPWGGHIAWLLCMVIQLLLLSGLGELLLGWERNFRGWLGRRKNDIGAVFIHTKNVIKQNDKGVITILGVIVLLWVLYLTGNVLDTGTLDVLARPGTLGEEMLFWFASIMFGTFLYIAPSMFSKAKEAVRILDPKKMPVAFVAVALLMLLFALSNQLGMWGGVLVALVGVAGLVGLWLKKRHQPSTPDQPDTPIQLGTPDQPDTPTQLGTPPQPVPKTRLTNLRDVVVVALAFLAPLLLTGFMTVCSSDGQAFIAGDKTEFTTWLNFGEAYLSVAGALLNLFI